MRSSILIAWAAALALLATGCAKADTARACHPVLSWAAPAYACSGTGTMAAAEEEPAAEAEAEPEAEAEAEPAAEAEAETEAGGDGEAEAEPEAEAEAETETGKEPDEEPDSGSERVTVKKGKIEVSEPVEFRAGKPKLAKGSEAILTEVAQAMKDHPEILKVAVLAYGDSGSKKKKAALAKKRAKVVVKFLVKNGVKAKRLAAKGGGKDEVEFKILKRKK